MGGEDHPVDLKGGDGVAAFTAGGGGMKEPGVLITVDGIPNLSTSPPVDGLLPNRHMQGVHGKGAEQIFKGGQGAVFFQEVEDVDEDAGILLPLE